MKKEEKCNEIICVRVSGELLKALKHVSDVQHWNLSKTIKKLLSQVLKVE